MLADVSRVWNVVYEEERSWSGVNRAMFKIYGTKPYQFEPTYLLLSTERRTSPLMSYDVHVHLYFYDFYYILESSTVKLPLMAG